MMAEMAVQTVKRDRVDKFVSLLEDENWYVLCRVFYLACF